MILTCDDQSVFFLLHSYAQRGEAKEAGFIFDRIKAKHWATRDRSVAERLKSYADAKAMERLGLTSNAESVSRQADTDIAITCPPGKSYRDYQRAFVDYAREREDVLLADEMGLGKTVEAIAAANYWRSKAILVVCPAILKEVWRRHLLGWLCDGQMIGVCWPGSPFPSVADVVVINYDILHRYHDELRARHWDLMVVDECQAIKGDSRRTAQVLGHSKWDAHRRVRVWNPKPILARRRIFSSGTPLMNRPADLWNILSSCGVAKDWHSYHARYAGLHKTRFGYDRSGATNLLELHELLSRTIMIRRRKADVLKELPPKTTQMIFLSDLDNDLFESEINAFDDHERLRERIKSLRREAFPTQAEYSLAVEQLTDSVRASFAELARLRKETGLNKMPKAVEYAKHILEGEEKIVIFTHHQEVTLGVAEALKEYGARVIIGGIADEKRQRAIDDFMKNPSCQVIVCSMKAGGVGLTLTAANTAVFVEFDYTPGTLEQAIDRLHRIGQEKPVWAHYLVKDGSLDARMLQRMSEKQQTINLAINGVA